MDKKYIKRLDDTLLGKVSGGRFTYAQVNDTTRNAIITGIASGVSALGFGIGAIICDAQAKKATPNKSNKLSQAALGLKIAATSCAGLAVGSTVIAKIFHDKEGTFWGYPKGDPIYGFGENNVVTEQYHDPLDAEANEDNLRLNSMEIN